MKNKIALALLLLAATACDGVPNSLTPRGGNGGSGSSSSSDNSGDQNLDDSIDWSMFDEVIDTNLEVSGVGGLRPTDQVTGIATDNLLKVEITPQEGGSYLNGEAYPNVYGCIQVSVKVGSQTRETKVLRLEGKDVGICASAPTKEVLNFSSALTGSGDNVSITFSNPKSDMMCRYVLATPGLSTYQPAIVSACPTKPLLEMHSIKFKVRVQTNSTKPLS
jgi:hypothetical protein